MKTRLLFLTLAMTGLVSGIGIDWSTIDGGGGTSTGGAYSVSGTIGQPDAGLMSGSIYTLAGGFWSGPEAIDTPGGPRLTVIPGSATSTLQWPAPSPGWRLERSIDLVSWILVNDTPAVIAGYNNVTVPRVPREFFRLRAP